jgi:hypothetical protein
MERYTHGTYLSSKEERNSMSINGQVKKRMGALNKVLFCINPGQKKKNRKFVELLFISILKKERKYSFKRFIFI